MDEKFVPLLHEHVENAGANCPFGVASALVSGSTGLMGKFGSQDLEGVIIAAKAAWLKYFVPLDLPGVPNLVEPMVEQFLWNAVEASIRAAAARLSS